MLFNRFFAKFRAFKLKPCKFSTLNSHESFFKVSEFPNQSENPKAKAFVKGEVIDHAIDLKNVRPGEIIEVPYEVTLSHSIRDFWQSAFYSHDRINTSTPFARDLGFQDQIVPFNLMLFLAGSMSHADHAKLQVGFTKAIYHWPAFTGDTFKKRFIIRSLRTTSDQMHSLFTITCQLINQRDVVVFTCDKTMLFPFVVPPSEVVVSPPVLEKDHAFLSHLIEQTDMLQKKGSQTLTSLRPGQLILHTGVRPLSLTHSMQLSTLARLTHERHFNTRSLKREELLVPGGLVLGLTNSLCSRDLHEVLYEELKECSLPNNLCPDDPMGAMTFIQGLEEHLSGELEAVNIRSIGVKHCNIHKVLADKKLPMELFTTPLQKLRPAAVEEILKKSCPELNKLIVCIADRKIYRQTPTHMPFLL